MMLTFISSRTVLDILCRVSSVLNRDTKQFGKKFMFDGQEETCWNSDQVISQLSTPLTYMAQIGEVLAEISYAFYRE